MARNKPAAAPEPPPAPPAAEPAAEPPKYVTIEDLSALKGDMATQLTAITDKFTSTLGNLVELQRRQGAPQPTTEAEITEDDIEKALQSGEGAGSILKRAIGQVERKLTSQLQASLNDGASVIGELSQEVSRAKMPYYELLKDDISSMLNRMDPGLRMRPEVIKHVYDTAAGANISKIVALEVEKTLRKGQENNEPAADPTNSRRVPPGTRQEPSFEEHFGKDSMDALKFVSGGTDPDQWARRLGYKDAADYLKVALEMEGANG